MRNTGRRREVLACVSLAVPASVPRVLFGVLSALRYSLALAWMTTVGEVS